jgi:hypothetical protein
MLLLPAMAFAAPSITSITPNTADNWGMVEITEIAGSGFEAGTVVTLTREGQPDVGAIYVAVESPTSIICKFNLTGTEPGHWDIVVTNPDGQSGISNSIDITAGSVDCTSIVGNTDFYVDDDGDNTNDGLTPATAWKTITYALNRIADCIPSPSGITLHVAAGTYDPTLGETFPLVMLDGVSLAGAGAETTILDAQGTDKVIYCYYIDTGESIEGFTIKNGNGYYADGGIYCYYSSPTIINCTISGNLASTGGGIYCYYMSALTITNCTIRGNSATRSSYGRGGGISCGYKSPAMISNCIISSNTATRTGGGIIFDSIFSPATITNCTISSNKIAGSWGGFGGGIACIDIAPTNISNCIISGNSATGTTMGRGGGILCANLSPAAITNSIINDNSATGSWGVSGGGIYSSDNESLTITNCTISGNLTTATYSSTGGGIYSYDYIPAEVVNSILWKIQPRTAIRKFMVLSVLAIPTSRGAGQELATSMPIRYLQPMVIIT